MMINRVSTGKRYEEKNLHCAGVVFMGPALFTSGIVPRDDDGSVVGPGDMRIQIARTFQNLGNVLAAAGTSFDKVLKFTIFTTDIEAFRRERDIADGYFSAKPAATLVEVSRLASPDIMVEVEAVVAVEKLDE